MGFLRIFPLCMIYIKSINADIGIA